MPKLLCCLLLFLLELIYTHIHTHHVPEKGVWHPELGPLSHGEVLDFPPHVVELQAVVVPLLPVKQKKNPNDRCSF